ncbi:hypothetical protein ACIQAD_28750 [Streptomyces sp. NPDC088551]|uniref:hypothetical protein n=1 Tax=unclassified Streptomyces TaxID=2593676 RepID=UPI00380C7ED6
MIEATLPADRSTGPARGRDGTFAYTWDIVGDPAAADRIAGLGLGTVTLQAGYHAVRAVSPRHPRHRIVHAAHAAAYFPLTPEIWKGQTLTPLPPTWGVDVPDRFGAAAAALNAAGLRIEAWLVLTHSSVLGARAPHLTVRNAFGEHYSYALCPAHPEVRAYALNLVREVCGRYDVPSLMLEACGWLGFEHGSHHEKTHGVDLSPGCRDLLSICLCTACSAALAGDGVDPDALAHDIRTAVDDELAHGRPAPATLTETLGEDHAQGLFRHRHAVIAELTSAVASVAPDRELLLMADDNPQATGPDSGVDVTAFGGPADAFVLKCWGDEDSAVAAVAQAVRRTAVPVIANVSVLEDPPDTIARRVARLGAAGAQQIRYYHAGLASASRLAALRTSVQGEQR